MYIWSKNQNEFYNSDNITSFGVDELNELWADDYVIGEYSNRQDALKVLYDIFRQLEVGATSYQVR